jgi:DNA-binding transcriptional MerR regulator
MAWSTREIAELAGTSLRAVRHYHEVGLLPEPERHSNGYKQYGVAHLVRLLRIKRLVDLGFSLSRIAELGDDDHHPVRRCAPWTRSWAPRSSGCSGRASSSA